MSKNGVKKVFSKNKWQEAAEAQLGVSSLTQDAINAALEIWVNDLDGKTAEEIAQTQNSDIESLEKYFVETEA